MIISLLRCTRSTSSYTRVQPSFIIFRWKKGGQKYTEYPRARRHPVDYFENIIAKRGEEGNGEEMEKGQAWFFLAPSLSTPLFPLPLLLLPAPVMGRFVSSRARDDRANYRETISYRAAHSNSTRFFLLSKIAVVGKLRNERTIPPCLLVSSASSISSKSSIDLSEPRTCRDSLPSLSLLFLFLFSFFFVYVASYVFAYE